MQKASHSLARLAQTVGMVCAPLPCGYPHHPVSHGAFSSLEEYHDRMRPANPIRPSPQLTRATAITPRAPGFRRAAFGAEPARVERAAAARPRLGGGGPRRAAFGAELSPVAAKPGCKPTYRPQVAQSRTPCRTSLVARVTATARPRLGGRTCGGALGGLRLLPHLIEILNARAADALSHVHPHERHGRAARVLSGRLRPPPARRPCTQRRAWGL